ncbi:MAG: type 1 glutamine amidotransferase [Acidimicrobiia bacterium]
MRALFVHHDQYSGADIVGDRLVERGWELVNHYVAVIDDPVSEIPFPDLEDFDLLAPAGAVWSVYDEETIGSWINRELELIRAAQAKDIPVFGICFGAQALAKALGGDVFPAPEIEVGWHQISTDLPEMIAPGPWFQWHEDTFSLPSGAVELARNDNGSQAYGVGRNFAIQFHPEVTADRVEQWIEVGGHRMLKRLGIDRDDLVRESKASEPEARANTYRMVDWFLDEVARF